MDIQELKERKKALKLTTNELSYLVDVPYSTLSKIFTGETQHPQFLTVEKIDKVLSKLEQERRIAAYQEAIGEYMKNHPDEVFDINRFEKQYRLEHHLSADPIPFAISIDEKTVGNLAIDVPSRMTAEDFSKMETDRVTELINGELVTAEMPSCEHQVLLEAFGDKVKKYIADQKGNCKVYTAGINLRLDECDQSVFVPDIIVRCKGGTITERGILGAPDWIIEITSPSTRKRDYRVKYSKYLDAGVREYWVVDLQKHIVATYINDLPAITAIYQFEDWIPVFIYENKFKIRVSNLMI